MEDSKCFISILNKLKTSSKEAVEGIDNFSDFKEYMHVEREVQQEFEHLIDGSAVQDKAQLILVCGSVGDGKSHIISYFRKNKREVMDLFNIHNDATESLDPKKTSIETLNDELNDFADENLGCNSRKMILAINLGTLTNFIDSDYGHRFSILKKYIEEKKILEQDITDNNFEEKSYFQYINFTDYHMFSLTKDGPKSDYIKAILNKVYSTNEDNPFYQRFKGTCCNGCMNYHRCPIRENYESLLSEQFKDSVIQKLIEIMIKNKVIISTRALLNFLYDLVVDSSMDNITEDRLISKVSKLKFKDYIKSLTANIIFDNKEASNIIGALNSIDPLNTRNEKIDALIVNINNTEKLDVYFNKYINNNESHYYYRILVKEDFTDVIKNEKTKAEQAELKQSIIKFFMRLNALIPIHGDNLFQDEVYYNYMKYLYHSNRKDKSEMKSMLNFVKETIYRWNGPKLKEGQIHLSLGKNQSKFKVYEYLEFMGKLSSEIREEEILSKFIKAINLIYSVKNVEKEDLEISIDYSLFDLLVKIRKGYRPNKKDKNNFINFVDFMKRIQEYGSHNEKILFDSKMGDTIRSFEFKLDDYGDYCLVEI